MNRDDSIQYNQPAHNDESYSEDVSQEGMIDDDLGEVTQAAGLRCKERKEKVMDFIPSRSLGNFQDLLADRYGTSDFMWMSRRWKPTKPHKQDHKTNPYKLKQDVLKSATVSYVIEEVSKEKNVSKEKLYLMAQEILDEIGYSRETSIIRWLGILLLKILKKTCNGFMVNECSVRRVISVMDDNPMIFAPSHRTYADFILMHYLCFHYDVEVPAIAAGIDFYSMWLMGRIIRDCGAFFMRRSFNNDKFYWTIFSEYVQKLVTDGEAAIEFFIEGTRSRSAKSLMPKFGFLSMTLMPFFTGRVPDITVVPINISYDRTLEEVLFAYELLGVPKPKESTSGLLKALRMLDERYGKVHCDFGQPISVRELCLNSGFQRLPPTPQSPQVMRQVTAAEMNLCIELAHRIVRQQQQLSVLSPFNIMAILLNNSVLEGRGPPLLADMIADVSWFKSVLEVLGALVDIKDGIPEVEAAVKEAISVHKSLVTCTSDGHLKIIKVHPPTTKIDPSKMKGHLLTDKTMDIAVPMVMLQHYVNPCLHYLINPALVTLILRHLNRGEEISRGELFQKFNFLRAVFTNEFAFYAAWAEKDFADALKHLELLSVVEPRKSGGFCLGNHAKLQSMLCNVLLPFLEGYLTISQTLPQIAEQPSSEHNLLKSIQCRVEQLLSSAAVRHPYALSLDMHSAALQSLASMQAVTKLRNGNGSIMYQARSRKLSEIAEELENLAIQCEEKQRLAEFGAEHFMMQRSQAKL